MAQPSAPPPIDLDTAAVDKTLGAKGKNNGGVYQFSIPRAEPIKDGGMEVPRGDGFGESPSTSSRPAEARRQSPAISCSIAKEVNPVLKALRENGIEVTAVHNHMLDDQPRLFFMHFWANDDAQQLGERSQGGLGKGQHRKELTPAASTRRGRRSSVRPTPSRSC